MFRSVTISKKAVESLKPVEPTRLNHRAPSAAEELQSALGTENGEVEDKHAWLVRAGGFTIPIMDSCGPDPS